jgi:hypothetical protein
MGVWVSRVQGRSGRRAVVVEHCGVWRVGAARGASRRDTWSASYARPRGPRALVRRSVRCLKSSRPGGRAHRRKRGRSCVRECPDPARRLDTPGVMSQCYAVAISQHAPTSSRAIAMVTTPADRVAAGAQHVVGVQVVGVGDARRRVVEVLLGVPVAVLEHPPPARPGEVALAAQQQTSEAGAGSRPPSRSPRPARGGPARSRSVPPHRPRAAAAAARAIPRAPPTAGR